MLTERMMRELGRQYTARCHNGILVATKARPSRKLNTSEVQRGGRLNATHNALAINIVMPPAMPGVSSALGCRNSSTLALSNYGFLIKERTRVASCFESTSTLCSAVYAGTDRPAIILSGEPVVESLWSRNVPSSPTANLGVPTHATSAEPGNRTTTCSPAWAPLMPSWT